MTPQQTKVGGILFLLLLLAGACGRDLGTPQGIAEEFLDQHYVRIDLPKAKTLAVSIQLRVAGEKRRPRACLFSVRGNDSVRRWNFVYPEMADQRPQRKRSLAGFEFHRIGLKTLQIRNSNGY
jgi:hypothetical protein